ncbi:hypothetical protein HBI62_086940 [Parastagonospora nodorum]|nr:hypothetical protein HBI62_086940 [Parastagonospora nodorum]KAH6360567.1 hypothetical protein HBI34_196920 [Parastagonospora nodorum]
MLYRTLGSSRSLTTISRVVTSHRGDEVDELCRPVYWAKRCSQCQCERFEMSRTKEVFSTRGGIRNTNTFPDARSSNMLGEELEVVAPLAPVSAADNGAASAGARVLQARRFGR